MLVPALRHRVARVTPLQCAKQRNAASARIPLAHRSEQRRRQKHVLAMHLSVASATPQQCARWRNAPGIRRPLAQQTTSTAAAAKSRFRSFWQQRRQAGPSG